MGKGGKEMLDNATPAEAGATDLPLIPKSGLESSRKTLIIFASPRPQGNTAMLVEKLKGELEGPVVELSVFHSRIAPCTDCRGCWKKARCVVRDEMDTIYNDDFDNVVIASPIYFGTMPGSMLSVMSRMQPWHVATFFLKKPLVQRPKKAAAILTAGGKGNWGAVRHHLGAFFRMLNAQGWSDNLVCSTNTDAIPSSEDIAALEGVSQLASWLNSPDDGSLKKKSDWEF